MKQEVMEAIDARIERIWKKMDNLPEELEFSCGEWPPRWEEPYSEAQVAQWEARHKVRLPEDYRRFITTKASGGTQPFYGLCSLMSKKVKDMLKDIDLSRPFPYTLDKPLAIFAMTEEEQEAYFDSDEDENEDDDGMDIGFIPLCTEGCGMDSILVVSAQDEATLGTAWFYDLANDFGIVPIRNQETKEAFSFLDWLEYWVDFTISHKPSEYFSYGELTGPFDRAQEE